MNNDESTPAIRIDQLDFSYRGRQALSNVSFAVERESIHAFVGPNGAGKTTTLKILATLLRPSVGAVRLCGLDVARDWREVRRRIGYMPDHFSMYKEMTVFEYLDFFAAAFGFARARRDKVIGDVLALTDMTARKDDLIKSLSRGMMQRVSLARVLINDPQVLLLDEPASGLDPRARIELAEILRELRRMGKTIFISSHILSELADLCDSVTIIDRGAIRYTGAMHELLRQDDEGETLEYSLELTAAHPEFESSLRAQPGVVSVKLEEHRPRYQVTLERGKHDGNRVLGLALECGASVLAFQQTRRHLNEVFMDLTEPGVS